MPFFASIGRLVLSPFRFISEVYGELQHVTWPTRQQTITATLVVIVFSLLVGLWIGGLDFVFTKAIGLILK